MKETNSTVLEAGTALKVSIFGSNLRDQSKGQFVIHATECRDCAKLRKLRENETKATYSSLLEISADIWADIIAEGSMTAEDGMHEMHFCPCVTLPHGQVIDGEVVAI